MTNPPPDSSIESSILILRDKKQFVHKISFALSCISQSLRPTNPRYEDNIHHLFTQNIWLDFALILNNYEDPDITQNILSILVLLLVSNHEVELLISQTNIMKGLEKNVEGVGKNIELFMSLVKRVAMREVGPNWEAQKAVLLSKLLVIKLSEANIFSLLAHLQDNANHQIEKADLFSCLANYDNTKISRLILYQIYRRIDPKKDRLSNSQMNQLLKLIEDNIGDCELSYIIYFVVSRFYTYKQALAANPDHKLIIAYVFALGEANMGFYPSFTDEKSFIYTFAILSEGDRFSECYTKVLMPKFSMINTEAAELKFLSELKKISLKEDVKLMYNPLKQTLAQSRHPQLTGQYQYLLKHLDSTHQIPGATSPVIIANSNFKTDREFFDYFTSILLLCVLFDADLPTEETDKFLQQALRFCKLNRELARKYLSFLSQSVIKLQSGFSKNENYQNLLVQVYIQCLQSSISSNKTSKLEEAIVRTFASKVQSLAKERDSVRLGVIMANLVTHPTSCQTALSKLGSLSSVLRSSDFKIGTKLHLIFRLLGSCEHSNKIDQAVFNFLQPVIDQLEKGQDNTKVSVLRALARQLPKLDKNHIYTQVISDKSTMFLLERMFYVLISLVKNLQCDQLFELIFELEQWMPLQEMLRRNQAQKILGAALQNYSPYTPDIIELCEVVFGDSGSDYFQKTAPVRAQLHKSILKNLDKYNLQALDAYNNALAVFGEAAIKQSTLEQIKSKPMQVRCPELKRFVFFHEAPSEDPAIVSFISESLRELAQLSAAPQSKGDSSVDSCATSLLVSVMWTFQDSEKDIPITIIESLNTLLGCPAVSTQFIRKALQAIQALPHTFNLAKIQYNQLYEKFAGNAEILSGLNQLIKIIAQSSPKALNNFKFEALVEEYLYFLVFEKDSELMESKSKFVETVCLVESSCNQFLQSKSFVLEKILKADLSNATFYRPKIIESVLNIMDQLSLLKGMGFQLCKLLEKYIDEPDIAYMILLNLKDLPVEEVTGNLDQRALANLIMSSGDKDLVEMSKGLMSHYHGVDTNKQEKFVQAFTNKNYGKCEELIAGIQKPHEVQFIKNQVNAFLGTSRIEQFPKVKQFIMTNKKAEPVLYECQTFYKDTTLLSDLVKKFEEIDVQYPVFSVQNSKVLAAKPSLDMNIDSIKTMIQKEDFIQNYAQSILKGDQLDQLPKVKLIILLSKIPELTALCDTLSVRNLLQKPAYQSHFYNSGIAFQLFNDQQVNVLSMINHLQAHLRQKDISKAEENDYVCRIVKFILNHKQKNAQYFIKLLEVIPTCHNVEFPSNIDMLANLSHQLMNIIHQHRKGLKFSSAKEEAYFNNLELILVEFYQSSVILSDINNLSMKTMDRMYSICSTTFQYDILAIILLKYLQSEQKDKQKQEQILNRFILEDKANHLSDAGKDVFAQIMGRSWSTTKEESVKKMLESTIKNSSVSGKHSNMETLREYSVYLDQLIAQKNVPENNRLTDVVDHMMSVCENQYYYNRILKQKMVDKLIVLFYIQNNEVLNVLLRLSHNKNNDILKSDLVIRFLKDRLKKILESKPAQSSELVKLITLLTNSEYNQFESYFNGGLYSALMEILKAKVMEKQILRFFVKSRMNEKLVNELYQRGLIQYSIERVSNKQQQSTQWVAFMARICINPAIQNKLLGVNIHQQVLLKFFQTKDEPLLKACAAFFTSLSFNNEVTVKWMIDKKIVERYISLQNGSSIVVEIARSMHSMAYNNNAGKKHIKELNGIQFLLKEYSKWAQGMNQSDYQTPWSIMKTLSTLAVDQQCVSVMIKEKTLKTILSAKILISAQQNCFNPIQLLHNILINVQSPKQYQELKADKLNELFKQIKLFDINSSTKQQECLIVTILTMAKWELAADKHIKTELFEYALQVVLKNNLSDEIANSVLTRFTQCVGCCKDVGVSQGIITKVQKIALKRKSNILDLQLLSVIEGIRDNDLVRSILSKGQLGGIVCDMYDEMKSKESRTWNSYLNCLAILAQSHIISDTIVSKTGSRLLESPIELHRLNVISCIAQYEDVAQYLIQLNAIPILARELTLTDSKAQLNQLFSVASKILRAKLLTSAEKQLWINALTKQKLPGQFKGVVENVKNLILGNSKTQLSASVKDYITKGVSCYLYKSDGSVSKLQVTVTKSLNEINCIKEGDDVVKPKWRVPINEIKQLVSYTEQDKYEKTNFYKSGFLSKKPQMDKCLSVVSKNNNLHISFPTRQDKQKWLSSLIVVQEHISQMLLMIR